MKSDFKQSQSFKLVEKCFTTMLTFVLACQVVFKQRKPKKKKIIVNYAINLKFYSRFGFDLCFVRRNQWFYIYKHFEQSFHKSNTVPLVHEQLKIQFVTFQTFSQGDWRCDSSRLQQIRTRSPHWTYLSDLIQFFNESPVTTIVRKMTKTNQTSVHGFNG